jgi:4-hydroxy-tetrahydrodipicolinate reductase
MIKLAVSGCHGRMGQRIAHLALKDNAFDIHTLLEHPRHPKVHEAIDKHPVQTDPSTLKGSDVLIEFTTPEATIDNLDICRRNGIKMVIGTTGLSEKQIDAIHQAATKIAIVFSSNMSIGVNILFQLTKQLATSAPINYTVRIIEAHHVHKKDAPSGTAKTLAETISKASPHQVTDIKAIREGEIIGDHDVIFESDEDILTIRHHAKSRDIFAKGSLVAAKFLMGKKSGLFTMQDVLGFTK